MFLRSNAKAVYGQDRLSGRSTLGREVIAEVSNAADKGEQAMLSELEACDRLIINNYLLSS